MRSAGTADELASHVWVLLPPSPVLVLYCRPSPEPLFACFHDARGSEDAPFSLTQGVARGRKVPCCSTTTPWLVAPLYDMSTPPSSEIT
jgi:hypothetical protein